MSSLDLENVAPHPRRDDPFTLDIERPKPDEENVLAIDHYELLRVGQHADVDTIERVYRTLADRFHPDNPITGDAETYVRLKEAYETLSNHDNREKYNLLRQYSRRSARFWLRGREFFDGVRGGQNRRLALLCLLYRQMTNTHDRPGLTVLDLEQLTGCTREEVTAALWYLCAKHWATLGEFTSYSITAEGFDFVESKLEERFEFRALATIRYYRRQSELDGAAVGESRFSKDALPLDIEPAITSEGNVSIADHYEILGLGPHADEEAIERVYRTLAARFHPENPTTGDARTFQRIREAYETLSKPARRAEYDTIRQRSKYSERFRLRGREFFEGIRGEQLRRLAVLCLLYRQAASEGPGLTILDLEQMTGCTREELGSPLWYLKQKQWAHFGEFTEYSITAAGFDVVENKLDDRESDRSRPWIDSDDTHSADNRGAAFEYRQADATLTAGQSPGNVDGTPRFLIGGADFIPEQWNSAVILESAQTDQSGEPPHEQVSVAQALIHLESAFSIAEQSNRLEIAAAPSEESGQSAPAVPQPVIPRAATVPEIQNLQDAGINATDIFQHLLRLHQADEPLDEPAAVTLKPARSEDAEQDVTRFEPGAEPAVQRSQQTQSQETQSQETQSQEKSAVMPQSLIEETVDAPKISPAAIKTEEAPAEQRAVTQERVPVKNVSEPAAPSRANTTPVVEAEPAETNRGGGLGAFVRRFLGRDAVKRPSPSSHRIYQLTPDYYPAENTDSKAAEPSREEVAVAPSPISVEETTGRAEQGIQFEDVPVGKAEVTQGAAQIEEIANTPVAPEDLDSQIAAVSPADEQPALAEVTQGAAQIEEASGPESTPELLIANTPVAPEDLDWQIAAVSPADEQPAPAEVAHGAAQIEEASGAASTPEPLIANTPIAPEDLDSQIAAISPTDIEAEESLNEDAVEPALGVAEPDVAASPMPDEEPVVAQERVQVEEAPGVAEPATGFEVGAELVAETSNSPVATICPAPIEQPTQVEAIAEQPAPQNQPGVPVVKVTKITPQSPGVTEMRDLTNAIAEPVGGVAVGAGKRVIFSMGGKGGVGKTSVMTGLAEWFDENQIPVTLLDLDTENKACGSLTHFFSGRVPKINIHTPAGLDAFIDHLGTDATVILADMGAGAGYVAHEWFDTMYPDMAETGVVFTAIGVVTPDPASVESVLNWAAALQDRVDYVIVENSLAEHADFTYWREGDQAKEFQQRFHPAIVRVDNRLAELENVARNYGATLGRVAGRATGAAELTKASLVMRAQSYRRRMFMEFDKVKDFLLP